MMKYLRQFSAGLLAAVIMVSCTACGKTEDTGSLANPVVSVTETELAQNTGIELNAPKAAEHVTYGYIGASGADSAIAQVQFTLDDVEYCYRAQPTSLTSLLGSQSAAETPDLSQAEEAGRALSGLNDKFKNGATVAVGNREGFCAWIEKKSGFVVWLDVVPGILYTLSTEKGASEDTLLAVAEEIFVPAQGEAAGDEETAAAEAATETEPTEAAASDFAAGDEGFAAAANIAAEGDIVTDVTAYAGTYTRQEDTTTLTIGADGSVQIDIERLSSMEGTTTGALKGIAPIFAEDPNGEAIGFEFNIETHELIVTDSQWELLENGTSIQFD